MQRAPRPRVPPGRALAGARFESLVQILPTFLVVVVILWLRAGQGRGRERGGPADGATPPPP